VPKVYITNRGGHDFSPAERFGELVYCTCGTVPRYNASQMYREVAEAMEGSLSTDYILLTSLTTLNSVACGLFGHKHGRLNLLLYRGNDYIERTIVFNGKGKRK